MRIETATNISKLEKGKDIVGHMKDNLFGRCRIVKKGEDTYAVCESPIEKEIKNVK